MLSASLCVIRASTCVGDCPIPGGLLLSRARFRFEQYLYNYFELKPASIASHKGSCAGSGDFFFLT